MPLKIAPETRRLSLQPQTAIFYNFIHSFSAMMLLYVSLLTYCGSKLRKLIKKYKND